MKIDRKVEKELSLQTGDLIIVEMPFLDAVERDFFPFNSLDTFKPGHSAMWTGSFDRAVAHSVREGYKLPGVRLTTLVESRVVFFRLKDSHIANRSAEIFRNWALSTKDYTKETYISTYPKTFFKERHEKDLREFFSIERTKISGPATPFAEPRATTEVH